MKYVMYCAALLCMLGGLCGVAGADSGKPGAAKPANSAWVKKKVATCSACHGPKGVSKVATYPVLAGQYQSYLVHALTAYRDGARKNSIMNAMASGLTNAQIKALAQYFSRQKSPLHTPWNH